ncbi:ATP-binding protein [Cellulosimicrobium cellulans]|uniref:ATP-binding protein n=1 Tax=Cellulosimicrobium cellulans TaxID=1710 RepID=UPI002097F84B|nr:SbcC/MukB-like Walker B domain-containing protein [Cellulosimicrobium cellulans]MCO7275005.1 hypothetical protein [Cellulosimicrobium cellulans]
MTAVTTNPLAAGQWRLARVELFNWGTFGGFTPIDVARKGHLVTGASGSGKSSLLDAVAAVLTPDKWLRFNLAAQDTGGRGEDRNLVSYVRGAWSKSADEHVDRVVTTYARTGSVWSGILLRYEDGEGGTVVAARLFHLRGASTDRSDLRDACLLLRTPVTLQDLGPFVEKGIEARALKTAFPGETVTTSGSHSQFYLRLRRALGIDHENALLLLHKTQSAKNLSTLDQLFRQYMLEPPTTFAQADNAVAQFGELHRAHQHVVTLREQAEHLGRMAEVGDEHEKGLALRDQSDQLLAALDGYATGLELDLSRTVHHEMVSLHAQAQDDARAARDGAKRARERYDLAVEHTARLGGGEVGALAGRVEDAKRALHEVERRWESFAHELRDVGIVNTPTTRTELAELAEVARRTLAAEPTAVPHDVLDRAARTRRELARLEAEVDAMRRGRPTNMDPVLTSIRTQVATEVGVPEAALPFAGELIDVRPEHAAWTGAIERVLRPFARTLLVRPEHLAGVRRAIDRRHLGTRFVVEVAGRVGEAPRPATSPDSLLHKVDVASGPLHDWLVHALTHRYDYACVGSADDLDAVARGVTPAGQVKTSATRYEKNDTHPVDDRRRWVLGTDNAAKLGVLLEALAVARNERDAAEQAADAAQQTRYREAARRLTLTRVTRTTWDEIDREAARTLVAARRRQLEDATRTSPDLRDAQLRRQEAADEDAAANERANAAEQALAELGHRLAEREERIRELEARLTDGDRLDAEVLEQLDRRFHSDRRRLGPDDVARVATQVTHRLWEERSGAEASLRASGEQFVRLATQFRGRWPSTAADLTTTVDDRAGYRAVLDDIVARGLPEHEADFLRLLRDRSVELVGHLRGEILDAPQRVAERVDSVNDSLALSPFDEGVTLMIEPKVRRSEEVTAFLADLSTVIDGSWEADDLDAAEQRFAVLAELMRRLASSESADRRWRQRCLDTREHVTFLAKVLDDDRRVVDVYDSGGGRSGGQRQRLVIFCLAAALRYQLSDEGEVARYGTVILDEAFDKADAEYTRMAMNVFVRFGFQMVLATPQKLLQTIEPYVGAVTHVTNPDRRQSLVADVTFEERS